MRDYEELAKETVVYLRECDCCVVSARGCAATLSQKWYITTMKEWKAGNGRWVVLDVFLEVRPSFWRIYLLRSHHAHSCVNNSSAHICRLP